MKKEEIEIIRRLRFGDHYRRDANGNIIIYDDVIKLDVK